mmetsp:Transcript_71452/g.214788  ORF Transcript_71452/g.214788 Transcript_71452/m.214788 type:complete len:266 (+) Transcript_71452:12-809(+)
MESGSRMDYTDVTVRRFTEARAALKIQRAARLMIVCRRSKDGMQVQRMAKRNSSTDMLGVVLKTDAMRGGHIEQDRTRRVLKRISVHDRRRASHMGSSGEHEHLQSLLLVGEFDPSMFCTAEVADMFRFDHQQMREWELGAWADVSDFSVKVDQAAIERRLASLKPQPPRKGQSRGPGRRYLVQRPATAAGLGARAARSIRSSSSSRPQTAPAATRRHMPVRDQWRAVLCLVIATGRFARAAAGVAPPFLITSGEIASARKARVA